MADKIRLKNVSRQNPLSIMLDTKGYDGEFESVNLSPGATCDLTKLQARSHQVKKLKFRGYLREIPIPKEPETEQSDEAQDE
jgi:hypothetical protein